MLVEFVKSAAVTLLVTVDPPGLAPIFLGLTAGMTAQQRRQVAWRATAIAFAILAVFGFVGDAVLRALGISLAAFRIAGGLLLFYIAFEMVFELRAKRKSSLATTAVTRDHIRNVAAFPLAIPLMAGPGAITATILLAGRADGDPAQSLALLIVIAAVCGACWLVYLAADRLSALLGVTGEIVLTRLLGVILAALAVLFVVDGVLAIGRGAQ
ncbi:MAG: MarC family protein [Methylobacteriaceae bacterium]|nr:MarC family protein [Methylobacteriaceae bacterium]